MSRFKVEMLYKDSGLLEVEVFAVCRAEAERKAKAHGSMMGFKGAVKKYVVRIER